MEHIQEKALTVLTQSQALVVTNEAEYVQAGEFIMGCKSLISEVKAFFKPMKQKTDAAHTEVCNQETNALNPVKQAMKIAGAAALPWKQERDRLDAVEAERIRQEKLKQREVIKLEEAEFLEHIGDTEGATQALQEAVSTPRPHKIESTVPKVAGLSTRKGWDFRMVSPDQVVRKYCEPDKQLIRYRIGGYFDQIGQPTDEQIKKLQEEIGGVEIFPKETFSGRTAK
jgi:hypothetical protein